MSPLLEGILVGMLVSIPTGPVGFLCVKRAMAFGKWSGIFSGLGSLVADMFFAAVIVFQFGGINDFISGAGAWIHIVGGVILLYIGWRVYNSHERMQKIVVNVKTLLGHALSSFAITLTNPAQIVIFSFIFSIVGTSTFSTFAGNASFIAGLGLGAMAWWITLSLVIDHYRSRYTDRIIFLMTRIAGGFIVVAGSLAILSTLWPYIYWRVLI